MNVYDFDRTLYRGDSELHFYFYALGKKPGLIRFLPGQAAAFFSHYLLKRISKTEMKQRFAVYLSAVDAEALLAPFWARYKKRLYDWYKTRQQPEDLVISASPRFLLEPICRELGIPHLIASEVDPKSGRYRGLNCHGQEKLRRYGQIWGDAPIGSFYSDSLSDTPLAQVAAEAFLIQKGQPRPWPRKGNPSA